MKRTISKLLGIAAFAITAAACSLAFSTSAKADTITITCTEVGKNGVNYPTDGNGKVGKTHAFVCSNTTTPTGGTAVVTVPPTGRTNTLFSAVSTGYGSLPFPAMVKTQLKTNNVKYFFFNNRSDADLYFSGQSPYRSFTTTATSHSFKGSNSPNPGGTRCGNTGFGWSGFTLYIAVAIYNNCSLDNTLGQTVTTPNPSLEKTIIHESGHAFDFTFSSFADKGNIVSARGGFADLRLIDRGNLTPPAWLGPSGWTLAQRNDYVCKLFRPNQQPSNLEKDLNTSLANANSGGPNGEVCNSSSSAQRYGVFVSPTEFTPLTLVDLKMPYFSNNKQEMFSELFAVEAFGTNGPAAFLQFTDNVLHNDLIAQPPISQLRAFNCVRNLVHTYSTTLAPPSGSTAGCVTSKPL